MATSESIATSGYLPTARPLDLSTFGYFLGDVPVEISDLVQDVYDILEGYGISSDQLSEIWIQNRIDHFSIPFIERVTRMSLQEEKEITEYYSGNASNIIILNRRPVNSITSIAYVTGADVISDINESVELDSEAGILIARGGIGQETSTYIFRKGKRNLKITYKYGFGSIDDAGSLKEAVVLYTARLVLVFIGARTGGGSIGVQSYNRNYGARGKYNDVLNEIDMMIASIVAQYQTSVVGI